MPFIFSNNDILHKKHSVLTQNKLNKMLKCKYHIILKNKYFFDFNYIELINNYVVAE